MDAGAGLNAGESPAPVPPPAPFTRSLKKMATQVIPTKRKLSKSEKAEVDVFKKALRYLTKDHAKQVCDQFMPGCPACEYNQLVGRMQWHIDNMEYFGL